MNRSFATATIVAVSAVSLLGATAAMANTGGAVNDAAGVIVTVTDAAELAAPTGGMQMPGDVETLAYDVINDGDVHAALIVDLVDVVGTEDGCTSGSETNADADCATDGEGDLLGQLHVEVQAVAATEDTDCEADATWAGVVAAIDTTLDAVAATPTHTELQLAPGERACVRTIGTFLDLAENNLAMGDRADATLRITLEQL